MLAERMAALNLAHGGGLPLAPPMYEEVMSGLPAYSALDDAPLPYSPRERI